MYYVTDLTSWNRLAIANIINIASNTINSMGSINLTQYGFLLFGNKPSGDAYLFRLSLQIFGRIRKYKNG